MGPSKLIPRQIVISPAERLSWQSRGLLFISVFGTLFLFIEALQMFGLLQKLMPTDLWGFIALSGLSVVVTALIELFRWLRISRSAEMIDLTLIVASEGRHYRVKAPLDMLVKTFLDGLLLEISRVTNSDLVKVWPSIYNPSLHIHSGTETSLVPDNKTLRDAGVTSGSVCVVRGTVREERRDAFLQH